MGTGGTDIVVAFVTMKPPVELSLIWISFDDESFSGKSGGLDDNSRNVCRDDDASTTK